MHLARTVFKIRKEILEMFKDAFHYMLNSSESIPIRYYDKKMNVGDTLNPYLISMLSGKKVYEVKSKYFSHLLGVGSIIHLANNKSVVWGSGVIDPEMLPDINILNSMRIVALRGNKSKQLLFDIGVDVSECFLGDPAVLMSMVYPHPSLEKKYKVGVVPHLVDKDSDTVKSLAQLDGVHIIDVADYAESFINNISECDRIISTSLHGLILADTYGIPNCWARFSDNIIGGQFKFLDYYSTTDNSTPVCYSLSLEDRFNERISALVNACKVNSFIYDKDELANSLPLRV